jgi:hypothetical protein
MVHYYNKPLIFLGRHKFSTPRVAGSSPAGIANFLAAGVRYHSSSFASYENSLWYRGFLHRRCSWLFAIDRAGAGKNLTCG